MHARFLGAALGILMTALPAQAADAAAKGHHLFVWAGDAAKEGNDFLAVIDADPASASYGRLVSAVETDQRTIRVHHTEYSMPASGMLFANDHDGGKTFIFDTRDPLAPKVAASFRELGGYTHPHSFMRLPNGNVLATFQHTEHEGHHGSSVKSGGLVEIAENGEMVRAASTADPSMRDMFLEPYGLVVLPDIDRVLSTNSSMHDPNLFSGVTVQLWRLSDLKLLKTEYLDVGPDRYAHISPEEPRVGPDGSVYVQTLACGLERITGLAGEKPKAKLVHRFPGNMCGVPTIAGRFLVQSAPAINGLVVLDLAEPAKPVEASRLTINDSYRPHWTGYDEKTGRIVVTSGRAPTDRLYLLKLDPESGALSIDEDFKDVDGEPGFSFTTRDWPHGWTGAATPHGAVFSK
ncbi:MAG: hypothetical protein A3E78_03580 [Alphaproteobacteria bacterium RIFCSPHIGHO2_12_FULL_63_12]|nr:MAG: hypothetical protein A3E78_03580 [Alphaproteobacteria bacterium RIFCSPHIGHO2_12_FULL_63_12]